MHKRELACCMELCRHALPPYELCYSSAVICVLSAQPCSHLRHTNHCDIVLSESNQTPIDQGLYGMMSAQKWCTGTAQLTFGLYPQSLYISLLDTLRCTADA